MLYRFHSECHHCPVSFRGPRSVSFRSAVSDFRADTPLLYTKSDPVEAEQRLVKRLFDIVLAVLMIVITSPIMLITAICVKSCDGGSVFYKQTRCTRGNREFEIIKFRSMIEHAEENGEARLAAKDDNRITPVGRVIRKLRLDELGEIMPADATRMQELTHEYAMKHGYRAYYLYRQKNITDNLENIGYAKPGLECLYNILIMEEKHTILALGAGASSKYVDKDEEGNVKITRVENVKSVTDYISRIDQMIDRKKRYESGR